MQTLGKLQRHWEGRSPIKYLLHPIKKNIYIQSKLPVKHSPRASACNYDKPQKFRRKALAWPQSISSLHSTVAINHQSRALFPEHWANYLFVAHSVYHCAICSCFHCVMRQFCCFGSPTAVADRHLLGCAFYGLQRGILLTL